MVCADVFLPTARANAGVSMLAIERALRVVPPWRRITRDCPSESRPIARLVFETVKIGRSHE
jgi:hypothetical protein